MSVGKESSREEGIPEGGRDVRGSSDRAGNILHTCVKLSKSVFN